MASFQKFQSFVEELAKGSHNLATDQLQVTLCAAANTPVNTDDKLADLTRVTLTNFSAQTITTTSCTQTAGVLKLVLADLILTASDTCPAFQFVVIFNQDATDDLLIGWYDYGSAVTLATGETFTIDFDGTEGLLQIT